ncbi:PDZ domain-containing protein [Campylobacter sp. 9BO]|uniref:DUF7488 domain-containing protein n=1 Tax=Campylobacter sp. 9BO TaxID=3424759 RepID=UPI003D332A0F
MRKILLFMLFFGILLAAPRPTQDDFHACYVKNKGSIVAVNGNYGVAIAPNLIAIIKTSKTNLNDYVKFDPYLGLYLVRSAVTLEVPTLADETNEAQINKSTWVGILSDNNNTLMGHIKSLGVNLGDFDTLSFDSNVTGELNSACCKMVGIAIGSDKFIPNRYLKHFAAYDDVYYGDIGVVFTQNEKGFFVVSSDPIGRGKALMVGDKILSINGIEPSSLRALNEMILFAPKGAVLNIKVWRDGEEVSLMVPVSGEISGAKSLVIQESENNATPAVKLALAELFKDSEPVVEIEENYDDPSAGAQILKRYGILIDRNLIVKKVIEDSQAAAFGVAVGDKILQLDLKEYKTRKELFDAVPFEKSFLLLFMRNDFNFFSRVNQR